MYTKNWQSKIGQYFLCLCEMKGMDIRMGKVSLSDGEWKIMNSLWESGESTITELTASLENETGWDKHIIITMLGRMEKKEAVAYGLDRYAALFDALRPVSFRLRKGQSGRTHLGLIAQDVEAAGLTGMDFAGLIKSPRRDEAGKEVEGAYDYALRYGEFTALCIAEIQGLKGRVTKLEGSILV